MLLNTMNEYGHRKRYSLMFHTLKHSDNETGLRIGAFFFVSSSIFFISLDLLFVDDAVVVVVVVVSLVVIIIIVIMRCYYLHCTKNNQRCVNWHLTSLLLLMMMCRC